MTTWETFRDALVVATRSALPATLEPGTAVNWAGDARDFADRRILLDVVSETSLVAIEDYQHEYTPGEFTQRNEEACQIVVQFRFESPHDSPDLDALWLMRRVRAGLLRRGVEATLRASGVEYVEASTTTKLDYRDGNRRLSTHMFDATFRFVFREVFTDPVETTHTIGSVDISGELDPGDIPVDLTVTEP